MTKIVTLSLLLSSLPFAVLANEAPDDRSAEHQIGIRGGWVIQEPEYDTVGKADDRYTGYVYGIDYTFLKRFSDSNRFKWGINAGEEKINNRIKINGSSLDLDYYSTKTAGVIAYEITQQIDVYAKLGLSYNYGDLGSAQINGVGVFETIGFSYQSSNGAFSAIETQIDSFKDDPYEAQTSLSLIIRAGFTF